MKKKPDCPPELYNSILEKLPIGNEQDFILVMCDLGFLTGILRRQAKLKRDDCFVFFVSTDENQIKEAVDVYDISPNNVQLLDGSRLNERIFNGMKFDVIVGNPPYDGKSNIHLKLLGTLENLIEKDGLIALVMPKLTLVRQSVRCKKYSSWVENCSMLEWQDIDMSVHFSGIEDILVWFIIKNDNQKRMVDLTVFPKKSWAAKLVTGLCYASCNKIENETFNVPLINCINADGNPKYGKFSTKENVERKFSLNKGKPILHINSAGSMIARDKICWLDETGERPFYSNYMMSFVFEDLQLAREAYEFLSSQDGKKYIDDWRKCGWTIGTAIELLFKEK